MITLKTWLQIVDHRITEGSDWYSNINDLYSLMSWDGCQDGCSFNIVFNTTTQQVYMVEACDFKNNRAYRVKDPSLDSDDFAWDDVKFIDLESDDDFIEKAIAIHNGYDYDDRVTIPLNIPDDELLRYMTAAHKLDITFNEFIELAVKEMLEKYDDKDHA